ASPTILASRQTEPKSKGDLGVAQKKAQQRMFGPVAVVPQRLVRLSKKGAVASTLTFHQRDVGIRIDLVSGLCGEADKWIVQRIQDQGRHSNAIEDAGIRSAG